MEKYSKNRTAVVILNWNGENLLKRFLGRVVENTEGADVIIVDNASTDGSIEWISEYFPSIRVIEFEKNYGYAEGYNRAISILEEYDNIILLNSDAAPKKGWIKPLEESLSQSNVVAVQPKILSESDPRKFEYAGAAGGYLDCNGYPFCRGRIFNTIEEDNGQYDTADEIFWASGAAIAVKRDAYLKVGGMDSLFFAHMEEIDLCWRLKLEGGKIVYQPKSVIYHLGGGSLDSSSPRKTYLNFRNNLLMLYKNLPKSGWKKKFLIRRRLLDSLAWVKFIITGNFKHGTAILKAHRDYRKMKGNYSEFPTENLLKRDCQRNILSDYYLKRKKTF